MLLTILGAIVVAVGLCGTIALVFKALRRPIPKGVIPLAAGIGMFGFMAWNENSWFNRQVADLPETITIIRTGEFSNFIQPWTVVWPRITRYVAIDTAAIITNDFNPQLKLVELIIAERYTPTRILPHFVDCQANKAAVKSPQNQLDDRGVPINAAWFSLTEDDAALINAVCGV